MKVCTKCLGNKKYRGMGNIMVNCDECLGVGAVKEVAKPVEEKVEVKKSDKIKPKSPVIVKDATDEKEVKESRTA